MESPCVPVPGNAPRPSRSFCWGPGLFFVRHRLAGVPARLFRALPGLIVLWGRIAALVFGTYAAGGADSFGYISQAELMAHGRLTEAMPFAPGVRLAGGPRHADPSRLHPRPRSRRAGAGLSSGPAAADGAADVDSSLRRLPRGPALRRLHALVLPSARARARGRARPGRSARCSCPSARRFCYQAMQPMSDVPVTAAWLAACCWRVGRLRERGPRRPGRVARDPDRPNLAPLAFFVVVACAAASREGSRGRTVRHMLVVCALHACRAHRARIHPERAIRIAARFRLRVVPRPLRVLQHRTQSLPISALADDGAFARSSGCGCLRRLWFIAAAPGHGRLAGSATGSPRR